jgi:hypothetical protein
LTLPQGHALFRSHRLRACGGEPGVGQPVPRRPVPCGDGRGPPKFPGNLKCACALVFDPGRTTRPSPKRDGRMAPARGTARAPALDLSRLDRKASALAVYASQGRLPHRHARLASRCWLGSPGWAWLPTRFLREVSERSLPPLPSFLGANPFVFRSAAANLFGSVIQEVPFFRPSRIPQLRPKCARQRLLRLPPERPLRPSWLASWLAPHSYSPGSEPAFA